MAQSGRSIHEKSGDQFADFFHGGVHRWPVRYEQIFARSISLSMNKKNSQLLGYVLADRRTQAGLPISTVAATAEISASYYSAIEHSKRVPPSDTLTRILDVMGFSEAEQHELKQMAAMERGRSPDDADLPEEIQALISDIRKAAAIMPPRFVKAIRSQIREILN